MDYTDCLKKKKKACVKMNWVVKGWCLLASNLEFKMALNLIRLYHLHMLLGNICPSWRNICEPSAECVLKTPYLFKPVSF